MESLHKGICAAKGFLAGAGHVGIKEGSSKDDLALIYSSVPCHVAAVYTTNKVKADCIYLTKEHLKNKKAQGVIVNSGNANAAAPDGKETAARQSAAAAKHLNLPEEDIIVASTGVIGQRLNVEAIEANLSGIPVLENNSEAAAKAIMTTDTVMKEASLSIELSDKTVYIGGICKGSGMIHPNMGTMLAFITTDAAIDADLLQKALLENTQKTFNRVSVDGDTSTNDMCIVMANGLAENPEITKEDKDYETFKNALYEVMKSLAIQIAADGEGASRLVTVSVYNADNEEQAVTLARSVAKSSLVKAAMFGSDANVGRALCAMGYSGADFDLAKTDVTLKSVQGEILVCKSGIGLAFDEDLAKKILDEDKVEILINLNDKDASATCWGCDLTYEYVKINGDYRS